MVGLYQKIVELMDQLHYDKSIDKELILEEMKLIREKSDDIINSLVEDIDLDETFGERELIDLEPSDVDLDKFDEDDYEE